MSFLNHRLSAVQVFLGAAILLGTGFSLTAAPTVVYTSTNAAAGNEVVIFERAANGMLTRTRAVSTGGLGSGAGLGSQSSIALADGWLLVVNAGSNDITVFAERDNGLVWRSVTPSGGSMPVSLTVFDGIVYVLNAGGMPNIAGFRLNELGRLNPISNSRHTLTGAGPAQVSFNKDGSMLAVTEKVSNTIETFTVNFGVAQHASTTMSSGQTPFGFVFTGRNRLIVSEAAGGAPGQSTVSSYALASNGVITPITSALPTTQSAACWVAITRDGQYAFTTNTGSSTISSLMVNENGSLTLMAAVAASTGTGASPIDLAFSRGDNFLYALNANVGTITGFAVMPGGVLMPSGSVSGLPASSVGIAAR